MKTVINLRIFYIVILILIHLRPCLSQDVYYHPQNGLIGLEDSSGTTKLLYRNVASTKIHGNFPEYETIAQINILDPVRKTKELFLSNIAPVPGSYGEDGIKDYEFWENDYKKYIVSITTRNESWGMKRFDSMVNLPSFFIPNKIFKSNQNDSLLFANNFYNTATIFSSDGGKNWAIDTLINGGIIGLSPSNDSVIFFVSKSLLFKSSDRGITSQRVDSLTNLSSFIISNDGSNIYRVELSYSMMKYALLFSSMGGNSDSWQILDTSANFITISLDEVDKRLYAGMSNSIKVFDNQGNLLPESFTTKNTILGIYKKPGSNKIYVESSLEIDEVTADGVTVLEKLWIAPDYMNWYPLQKRNTWIYKCTKNADASYYSRTTVLGDTVLSNGSTYFKVISDENPSAPVTFLRYDPLMGRIYTYSEGHDTTLFETCLSIGDTIHVGGLNWPGYPVILANEESLPTDINHDKAIRTFHYKNLGNSYSYQMQKSIGLLGYDFSYTNGGRNKQELVAFIVDGKQYGDTTLLAVLKNNSTVHDKYALHQNYPNPFNPSTRISYALPAAGRVTLSIYSVAGSLIATIVDGYQSAGNHSVEFNAKGLASGMYIYRLSAGSFVQNKKMLLLK